MYITKLVLENMSFNKVKKWNKENYKSWQKDSQQAANENECYENHPQVIEDDLEIIGDA